jgi:hypothetical protein
VRFRMYPEVSASDASGAPFARGAAPGILGVPTYIAW